MLGPNRQILNLQRVEEKIKNKTIENLIYFNFFLRLVRMIILRNDSSNDLWQCFPQIFLFFVSTRNNFSSKIFDEREC